MPKKNFDLPLLNLNGEQIAVEGKPYAMKEVVVNALLRHEHWEHLESKKAAAGCLAVKVYSGKEKEYTIDELSLIKDRVRLTALPLEVHRVMEYLDK